MKTGFQGTSVISWSQTEVDGVSEAPPELLTVGATWRWTGAAVRVDGAGEALLLQGAEGTAEIRRRAARKVRRLIGVAQRPAGLLQPATRGERAKADFESVADTEEAGRGEDCDQGFVLTDGLHSWSAALLPVPDVGARLVMFTGALPPADRELWVVRTAMDRSAGPGAATAGGGVICFTPDTRIATPSGTRRIADLAPGEDILTRDNGPQPVLWSGFRRMTGARLFAMPHLRPIRLRAGALGTGAPDGDLLVSPQHRMLVRGPAAQALYNTPEVLVRAADLIDDRGIATDRSLREVTYVHILLERHNIVWANGLETESFHPSNTDLDCVAPEQRAGLMNVLPALVADPLCYGDFARRNLSASEAAILRHDMVL